MLKRELAEVRRAVMPLREPIGRFTAGVVDGIHPDAAPYFRDVGDHLARIAETVDNLDSLLSAAFEAQLAQISIQQNDDMRKISAGVALFVAPTLVGSIYGMNFEHMPELGWVLGYPARAAADAVASWSCCWWCSRGPAGCSGLRFGHQPQKRAPKAAVGDQTAVRQAGQADSTPALSSTSVRVPNATR